jgi:valyl-tRNA synthetase
MATEPAMAQMARAYEPHEAEAAMYTLWERGGYFSPVVPAAGPNRPQPFSMIMPPPNVNGELHMGHALMVAIEDVVTRWHRMLGEPTLWLPGTDHAGIATQLAVERELALEGVTRQDLGREQFVEQVWKYVGRVRNGIYNQTIRLGASCDWSRRRFTMDDVPQLAVRTTFKRLYDDGLIYRGTRIINWCPRCMTALSDLEVDAQEEQGFLYHVKYPVIDAEGAETGQYLTMATTRPETIVGDTAVAVNPDDPRYTALHGARLRLPIIGREIPVVTDAAVELEFGTGAVKVTPGHDPTDWEIGQRHDLPVITVINPDATMNENAGPYAGYDRFEARKRIIADFEAIGYLVQVEPYTHSVGHCDRCDTIVEPLVSPQWYVKMTPLAKPAIEAVTSGAIRVIPERYTKVYLNWMENIRDWCISRQLWWGHRIPVWYCDGCDEVIVAVETPERCPNCGAAEPRQDEDVLDTWFSSGLWTHSTLGWPHDTEDLRYFYPTTLMETGWDILFFWVARMIVLGLYNMNGEIPFKDIYLHGMVRDDRGRKMSKTKGNGVDPLVLIDEFGADAVRFALVENTTPGNDLKWSREKVERAQHFCNKLWNATRFVLGRLDGQTPASLDSLDRDALPLEDRWLLSRLNTVAAEANQLFGEYNFAEAGRRLDDFVWDEFCDWYIEAAKVRLQANDRSALPVLAHALEAALRLLHPFVPFVTEAIWQNSRGLLPGEASEALIIAPYPQGEAGWRDADAEKTMTALIDAVRAVRNIRAERKLDPARRLEVYIETADRALHAELTHRPELFKALARVQTLHVVAPGEAPSQGVARAVLNSCTVVVPLAGIVDSGAARAAQLKELQAAEAQVERLSKQLANEGFLAKAPAHVVEKLRADLAIARSRVAELRRALDDLG